MPPNSVVIVSGVRSPQARQNGELAQVAPHELAVLVAARAIAAAETSIQEFGGLYWGVMYQTEGDSVHLAKQIAVATGLHATVPALLVNRLCGSGLEAVIQGAHALLLGEANIVMAGSSDFVSRASLLSLTSKRPLQGLSTDENPVMASTLDPVSGKRMAELADIFARSCKIERAALDQFAWDSRQRARMAQSRGLLHPELVCVPAALLNNSHRCGPLAQDQIESRWPSYDELARVESPYGEDGRVTRANSSAFADGAAGLILTNESAAHHHGYPILGRILSWAVTASDADKMGEAMVSAMGLAVTRAGVVIDEIDWFELEEAFAVNCVYASRMLSLPVEKVNPHGGSLAFGHPPATSGLRLLLSLIYGLKQTNRRLGLLALAAGGSQGMAMVIENAGWSRH